MDLNLWKQRKKELHLNYDKIAELTGLPKSTVTNIFLGYVTAPRIDTVEAIEKVLGIKSEIAITIPETVTKLTEQLKAHVTNAVKTLDLLDGKLNTPETVANNTLVGKSIKTLRKRRNITQLELSTAVDISQYTLSGYERDIIKPDVETALKIANYFGVTVDYLLRGADND